jgi:putative membrane protein
MLDSLDDLEDIEDPRPGRADPDSRARTHLANERTFLAWIRTAMTFMTLGLAAAQFLDTNSLLGVHLSVYLATLLVAGGMAMAYIARRRYLITTDLIERGISRFPAQAINFVSLLLITIGLLATGFIFLVET